MRGESRGQLYTLQAGGLNGGEQVVGLEIKLHAGRCKGSFAEASESGTPDTSATLSATLLMAASCSLQQVRYIEAFASWFAKAIRLVQYFNRKHKDIQLQT